MTELEKAADDYATSNSIDQHTSIELYRSEQNEDHEYTKSVFAAGAEWQAKQSPWISVEDRLPEDGLIDPIAWNVTNSVVALTSNGNAIVTKRRWNCTLKTWEWKGSHTFVNSIVKWMPIPESP